jgi:hypothetical protein
MPVCVFILDEGDSVIDFVCLGEVKGGRQVSEQYHGNALQVSAHRIFSEIGKGENTETD